MDEPTYEQQADACDNRIFAWTADAVGNLTGDEGEDEGYSDYKKLERDLHAAAATIRRHAELVRLCREYIERRNDNPKPSLYIAYAALVAAIGKEP